MNTYFSCTLIAINIVNVLSENYFIYDEVERDISVEIPLTYVHYGITKEILELRHWQLHRLDGIGEEPD